MCLQLGVRIVMKNLNRKTTLFFKTLKLIHQSSFCVLIVSLLHMNTSFARLERASSGSERGGSNVQNQSDYIKRCESWYLEAAGPQDLPWYELKTQNSSYTEALFKNELNSGSQAIATKVFQLASKLGRDSDASEVKFKTFLQELAYCEGYFAATTTENYSKNNSDAFSNPASGGSDDQVNAQAAQCLSMTDQAAAATCMQNAQSQGGVSCTHEGWETHDYIECKRLATFMTGFTVGKAAMELQQTYRVGSAQIDAQQDLLAKQNTEEGIGMTDTLEIQKDSLEQQGNMAYEMAAYNAAKAGILLSMINTFPTRKKMREQCLDGYNSQTLQTLQGVFNASLEYASGLANSAPQPNDQQQAQPAGDEASFFADIQRAFQTEGAPLDAQAVFKGDTQQDALLQSIYSSGDARGSSNDVALSSICETSVMENNHFLLNQEVLDKVKEVAMGAGLEAIANGAQAALLNKQAGIVEDAIDDIEEFEKPEFAGTTFDPSLTSECVVDPEAEGCIAFGSAISNGFGSQSFNSSATGSANLGSGSISGSDDDGVSSATATDRNLLPNSFGSVKIGSPTDTSFADGKVRAGTIKAGQGGGSGGGGGGGSGGASLPAAGSSGGGGTQAAAASSGASAIKVGTVGSGMGRVTGGRGSIGQKTSTSANPFSKLLGKTAGKSATLNFRGPAQIGQKKGSLFERISTRYQAVSKDDKLLKYEATVK